MQQNIQQTEFARRFVDEPTTDLVAIFNKQVNSTGWTAIRAFHDWALISEFQRRGIDVSVVCKGNIITFSHRVKLNQAGNQLVFLS